MGFPYFLDLTQMTHSLMSIFDPNFSSMPLKWSHCVPVFFFLSGFFLSTSEGSAVLTKKGVMELVKLLSQGIGFPKHSVLLLTALFLILLSVNEIGMFPFAFTSTSHLVYNLSLSLPFWGAGILMLSVKSFLSHLVPQGSPSGLAPFLVFIELISLFVRPLSLSIRLMSNIMAGHMVLCLIQSITSSSIFASSISIILSTGFMGFELAVALVQAFVFVNLTYMYLKESEH